jgi:serine phosphatase RsbU (regulator of sigma subunit)
MLRKDFEILKDGSNLSPKTGPLNEELMHLLSQVPLFADLPRSELKYLSYTLRVLEFDPDTVIFREGEVGDVFAIVIKGHLDVVMGLDTPDARALTTLGPGEYVGEMSLLIPGGQRSASVRANGEVRLWAITHEDFDALLHRQPRLAYSMIKVMSARLMRSNNTAFHELLEINHELQAAYNDLKNAQKQIVEKERLEKELQLAAEIQASILPRTFPNVRGFDFGGHMDPARAVGGDFFDIFQIDAHRVGVLIGDVTDKGIPSAIFMARTHALITAEGLRGEGPGVVLRDVNYYLNRLEQNDLFVTAIYGILDTRTGEFSCARAGHELPMLIHADGQIYIPPMQASLPIGIFENLPLDEQTFSLAPGDHLLLFTDGLSDCRNQQGEQFGRQRIKKTLTRLTGLSAQAASDALMQDLLDFRNGAFQDDDVTLTVLHCSASL